MGFFCRLFGCHCNSTVEVVARLAADGEDGAVNILGPDGRNYALYYRTEPNGVYEPVYLVDDTMEDL